MSMQCTACRRPYRPQTVLAPYAAAGIGTPSYTPGACECGGTQFEGAFSSADTCWSASPDDQRLLEAMALAVRERIGVLPADGQRTDWAGYMTRKREKRKGSESFHAYAPTPAEAIEATWAAFMASNDPHERASPVPGTDARIAEAQVDANKLTRLRGLYEELLFAVEQQVSRRNAAQTALRNGGTGCVRKL